jgi:hypothetical protein
MKRGVLLSNSPFMKTFRTAILIAGVLVAGLAYSSVAQSIDSNETNKEDRTYTMLEKPGKAHKHEQKHKAKEHKHQLKRERTHEFKHEVKAQHKVEARTFKHEMKDDSKSGKAQAKTAKMKIRPHDKMKARKYKAKT